MKEFTNLTNKQQELVENHLFVVEWTIKTKININENIQGMGYDDLFQTGCLALCKAAIKYNGNNKFETFAQVVVKNALIDHCRKINKTQSKLVYMDNPVGEYDTLSYEDSFEDKIIDFDKRLFDKDTLDEFNEIKKYYEGTVLKGIEAIELKLSGYSGKEIAYIYGVKQNHIGAWISRASKRLKEDNRFLSLVKAC